MSELRISVIIPCLNEEETIKSCIEKAKEGIRNAGVEGEIIVVDNGSTDRSTEIAKASGARFVNQSVRGYGAAYLKGIKESRKCSGDG